MHVQRRGFHLWRLFSTVIGLTENVRQSGDKEYQAMVGAVRRGVWTDDCISKLNTRVMSERQAKELPAEQPAVVVFTNKVRTRITQLLLGGAGRGMPRRVAQLFAVVRAAGRKLTVAQQQALLEMPSQATGELEMLLDVYCGLPVHVTKNLATELGVANGTRAVVEAVQFPRGATFRSVTVDGGGVILVPSMSAEIFVLSRLKMLKQLVLLQKHTREAVKREHLHLAQVMGSDASESSMNETVARLPVVGGARRYGLVAF
ncbi:hypothetical protein I4F81_006711 [Pyropia yezoensis]|uniref:Uncharacterized protein n=1 Tax=Pyropia yezoensis TaxID=2788 RepID=A0ACC3C2H8_PYRYE|nr:hypothetical protein I4F81_006711 [Neopyropia yezoensis]